MKYIIILSMSISLLFMFMKHALSMSFLLLVQTINSSIMVSYWLYSYLMSYILFLILVVAGGGGELMLFMYMSSIASNEKFFMSSSLLFMFTLSAFLLFIGVSYEMNNLNFSFNYSISSHECFNLSKLYMMPKGITTILIVIYLLFTMIIAVNIIGQKIAPLQAH